MRKLSLLSTLFLFTFVATGFAQERTIRGQVLDDVTGEAISFPQLTVQGTAIGTVGDEEGRYVLSGAPDGAFVLVVQRIGYLSQLVNVSAGQDEVDASLKVDYLNVEALVVTGRATETRRLNLANSVGSVDGEELNKVPQQTIDKALAGRVAGAIAAQNSGAPGGGLQLNIRGSSSLNAAAEVLYVIDGVIVSNVAVPSNQNELTAASGGSNPALNQDAQQNRIADINPEDIESIEVLKGASAAAMFGSKASNGVVIITTKRGTGAAQVRLGFQGGYFDLSNTLGARVFETQAEAVATFGNVAIPLCPSDPCPVFDNEQALAFRNDFSYQGDIQLSGGAPDGLSYFASGQWKNDEGIIQSTSFERQSGRANISTPVGGGAAELSINTNLIRTNARRGLTNNDNATVSYYMVFPGTPSFIDLRPRADADGNRIFPLNTPVAEGSNPLQTAALLQNDEVVFRLLGSANLDLTLVDGASDRFHIIAPVGVDFFNQSNRIFSPPELFWEGADGLPGTLLDSDTDNLNINFGVNGIWTHDFGGGASLTSSTGLNYEFRDLKIDRIIGRDLTAGKDKADAAVQIQVRENRSKVEDFGFYFQEELLAFDERLLLTGMVRFDQSSANADPTKLFAFPKGAVSYRVIKDGGGFFDEVKARFAFGQSGNQPLCDFRTGCQKFTSLELDSNIEGNAGFTLQGRAGSEDLSPERMTEYEGGIDFTGLDGRFTLELTGYFQRITDVVLQRNLAPSTGFVSAVSNQATLRNSGIEATLGFTPFASRSFTWVSRTTFFRNRSEVQDLKGLPPFSRGGFGLILGAFFIQEGESFTQIVGTDNECTGNPEVDSQVKVSGGECLVSPEFGGTGVAGLRKAGNSEPDFNMAFVNDWTFGDFNLYTMFEWRYGQDIINLTQLLFDLNANTVDFEQDGSSSDIRVCHPECSGAVRAAEFLNSGFPWTEPATFFKARDISLTWSLPQKVASAFFKAKTIRIRASARNLFTISDYSGLDPEVSNFGNQQVGRSVDVAPFPPSRSLWLGFDITF